MGDKRRMNAPRPLREEAAAREKWRGGESLFPAEGDDSGLPASEADDARLAHDGDGDGDGRPGKGGPGAFPPPD